MRSLVRINLLQTGMILFFFQFVYISTLKNQEGYYFVYSKWVLKIANLANLGQLPHGLYFT